MEITIPFYTVISISSVISLISSLVILHIYNHYPQTRKVYGSNFVIIFQSLDLLVSIVALIPTPLLPSQTMLCTAQGFILHALPIAEILWTALMSAELVLSLRDNKNYFHVKKSLFIIIILGILSAVGLLHLADMGRLAPGAILQTWC